MDSTPSSDLGRRTTPVAIGLALLLACAGAGRPGGGLERGLLEPLQVILAHPQGDVERLGSVDIVFSKPMIAAGERVRTADPAPLEIDPPIRGTASWTGSRVLRFIPEPPVRAGTRLTCRILKGTKSLDGDALASDHVWEIIVGGPRILGSLPPDQGRIAAHGTIHLLFRSALEQEDADLVRLFGPNGEIPLEQTAPDSATAMRLLGQRPAPEQREAILALRPLVPLAIDEGYRIEVASGVPASSVPVNERSRETVVFRTYGAPRIETAQTDVDGITLRLAAPVDPDTLRKYLEVEPGVADLGVRALASGELRLEGDFRGVATYVIRLRPGLPSTAGTILDREEQRSVTTAHRRARLAILPSDGILERTPDAAIRIEGTNLDTVKVFAAWIPADSLPARLIAPGTWQRDLPPYPIALWHLPRQRPDSAHAIEIPLEQLREPRGRTRVLMVRATGRRLFAQPGEPPELLAETLIQSSNLGLSVFAGEGSGVAWVTSLRTGEPVEDAEILLYAPRSEAPLWSGRSSAGGLVWMPGLSELSMDAGTPLVAEARTADDAVWLTLATVQPKHAPPCDTLHGGRHRGALATDRPSYLPGEAVRWVAFARNVGWGGILPFDRERIGYRVTSVRSGRTLAAGSIELTAPGNAAGSFAIPTDRIPGPYRFALTDEADGSGEPFASQIFSIGSDPMIPVPDDLASEGADLPIPSLVPAPVDLGARAQLELSVDQAVYTPGDTAYLRLSAPAHATEALVLVLDDGIRQVQRLAEIPGSLALPIPLAGACPPGISIQALVLGPSSASRATGGDRPIASCARGQTDLRISSDPWRLDVAITTDREVYTPGEEVTVEIVVRDAQGRPVSGTATIGAVDEPTFASIAEPTTDPLAALFSARGTGVRAHDTRDPLFARPSAGEDRTSSGEFGSRVSDRITQEQPRSTIHWQPLEPLDPEGRTTVRFAPADETPRCRIGVLATAGADRFGYGEATIELRKSLRLTCAVPRFVNEGDAIEIGATVENRRDRTAKVQVEADAEGATIDGKHRIKLKVKTGEGHSARFRLTDARPDSIRLRLRAWSKEDRDSLMITIPVRRPFVRDRSFLAGTVDPSIRTVIEIPGGVLPEIGGLTTIVSPSVLWGLEESVLSVMDQHHESFEGLASSLVGIATRRRLLDHFGLPDTTGGFDPAGRIAAVAERMQLCMGPQEIYAWPSLRSRPATDRMIAEALFAATRADAAGYDIPRHLVDRLRFAAEERLHQIMPDLQETRSTTPASPDAPWLLWALSEREGNAPADSVRSRSRDAEILFAKRLEMPVDSRIALGMAIANLGRQETAAELRRSGPVLSGVLEQEIKESSMQRVGRYASISASRGVPRGINDEDLLATALFVRLLSLLDPGDEELPGMVQWIQNQRRPTTGAWRNPVTSAWTLHLLVESLAGLEGPQPEISGRIAVGSVFESFRLHGRDRHGERMTTPMDRLVRPGGGGASCPLRIETDGRRSVYFSANLDLARPALEIPPREEGLILDRFYGSPDGARPADEIVLGDTLLVNLNLVVPQDAKSLSVEDPLPAGLELPRWGRGNDARLSSRGGRWVREAGTNLNIVHRTYVDGRSRFYAEDVPAGVYQIRYPAIATTAGVYGVPGATATVIENPEINAISSALEVRIKRGR